MQNESGYTPTKLTPAQTAWGIVKVLAAFAVFFGLLYGVDLLNAR